MVKGELSNDSFIKRQRKIPDRTRAVYGSHLCSILERRTVTKDAAYVDPQYQVSVVSPWNRTLGLQFQNPQLCVGQNGLHQLKLVGEPRNMRQGLQVDRLWHFEGLTMHSVENDGDRAGIEALGHVQVDTTICPDDGAPVEVAELFLENLGSKNQVFR